MLTVVNLILGAGLLLAGRKLFWLFVAAVGFLAGAQLALRSWDGSEWTALVAGIALGLIFAVLALFFKSLAIGVAGFIGGGTALLSLAGMVGMDSGILAWVAFLIGGVLGIVLLTYLVDWALILLSSLGGGLIIVRSLGMPNVVGFIALIVLAIVGIAIQTRVMKEEKNNA